MDSLTLPNESDRLAALRTYAVLDTDAERCLDDLTLLAAHICQTPIALISLVDQNRQWFKSRLGLEVAETPRGVAFCAHAIQQPDLFIVSDTLIDSRFADNPLVTADPHIRFYAGAPLLTDDGHALGTLCVIDRVPRDLTEAQREALQALSRQVMRQLELRVKIIGEEQARLEGSNAQEALRRSEQRLKQIVEHANDIIYQTDLRGRFTFVNPVMSRLIGLPAERLMGLSYTELVRFDQRRAVEAFYERQFSSRTENTYLEFPAMDSGGRTIWLGQNVQLIVDQNKVIGFQAVARDITDRKRMEEALRESESRYRVVAETASDAIITLDEEGHIHFANAAAEKIFGHPTAELINAHMSMLMPEYLRCLRETEMKRSAASAGERIELEAVEVLGLHQSGAEIPLEISFGEFERDGKRFFTWIIRDVTERKRAEEALRKSEEYRNLFQLANDAILIFDPRGEIILDVNDKACETYGLARERLLGRSLKEFSHDAARGEHQLRELLGRGKRHVFESTQRRADGTPVHFLISSSVIEYRGQPAVLSINRDITDRKRAEERLSHNAFHDALTGLPNRALFVDHLGLALERAKRREGRLFAVLFLDLDRFKLVNDSLGHLAGDRLLVLVAERLRGAVRPGDTVARLGGDEFCLLLADVGDVGEAIRIAERVQQALARPFTLLGQEVFTGASIGICLSGAGYRLPEEMLRDADAAMYRAKGGGKNRHEVFDAQMHTVALRQLQMETDLRRAVERGEFFIQYQPIVRLDSSALCGFEALVRWRHPERGVVPPAEFIPLAEETGLIVQIGRWVIAEACRQMTQWRQAHPEAADWAVSVNLSGKQFQQADLVEEISFILRESGLHPSSLKLEITESTLMESGGAAVRMLDGLRALGIELSIDDFGTGYSSLSYLHRLPVDWLKIDRSFVTRMAESVDNLEIVRTIVLLARSLGMKVVAEGVETEEQMEHLRALYSDCGQGYLFSRPLDADGVEELIRRWCLVTA